MKIILFIAVGIIVLIAIIVLFVLSMGKSKKKAPPPILPKQYHDRYPKRSEFLEKGAPVDEEMPKHPDENNSDEDSKS